MRWRERLAPLFVLGVVVGVLSAGSVPDLAHEPIPLGTGLATAGPATTGPAATGLALPTGTSLTTGTGPALTPGAGTAATAGPATTGTRRAEFTPARAPAPAVWSSGPAGPDVADLRHGGAKPADSQRIPGTPGHPGPAIVDTWPAPGAGASPTGRPPAAVRPVFDVVAPRLGRAPPSSRVS